MDDVTSTAVDTAQPASAPAPAGHQTTDESTSTPNPIRTEPQPAAPDPKPVSTREALEKAAAKVEKDTKEPADKAKDAPKPVQSEALKRDDTGKFAPKADQPPQQAERAPDPAPKPAPTHHSDAPSRFSADAKTAWATAPESVRAETHRAIRELEQGYEKHRAASEAYEDIREFDDLAKRSGTTMRQAMTNYVGIEMLLRQDPIAGLEQVANNIGFSLRDIAAHIMGQSPEQVQSQTDATVRALKQEIAELRQQVGGVSSTMQGQRTAETVKAIEEFADNNPRFDELADDIEFFLTSGRASSLDEAYGLAERLNPAPQSTHSPALTPPIADITAQTVKGSKSVTGAPGPGSDPVAGKPSSSIRDALKRAAAAAG